MCHGIGTSVCRYFASLFVCLFIYSDQFNPNLILFVYLFVEISYD